LISPVISAAAIFPVVFVVSYGICSAAAAASCPIIPARPLVSLVVAAVNDSPY